jgi:hypothetical protein
VEETMRKLSMTVSLTAVLLVAGISCCGAEEKLSAEGALTGTLTNKHRIELADNSNDPSAMTVGEFMRDYPRGAPTRMRMFPTKDAMELTVQIDDGKRVKVVQEVEDSRDLEVGSKVSIDTIDGKKKVVAIK